MQRSRGRMDQQVGVREIELPRKASAQLHRGRHVGLGLIVSWAVSRRLCCIRAAMVLAHPAHRHGAERGFALAAASGGGAAGSRGQPAMRTARLRRPWAARSTSSRVMRPPGPVPLTRSRSTSSSVASLRATGLTSAAPVGRRRRSGLRGRGGRAGGSPPLPPGARLRDRPARAVLGSERRSVLARPPRSARPSGRIRRCRPPMKPRGERARRGSLDHVEHLFGFDFVESALLP